MPGTAPVRFAYLGPEGTFCEQALRTLPAAAAAERVPCVSVADALDAVRRGEVSAALVPLENSIEGSVAETLDTLAIGDPLHIPREVLLPVSFALMARTGTTLEGITTVTTMPHAEAQVRSFLRGSLPQARFVAASSTAAGAPSADRAADATGPGGSATNLGDVGDLSSAPARRRLLSTIDATKFSETASAVTGALLPVTGRV